MKKLINGDEIEVGEIKYRVVYYRSSVYFVSKVSAYLFSPSQLTTHLE